MVLPQLKRHLYVCGLKEVPQVLRRDPKFWNVVSIREPSLPKASFIQAKKILHIAFYDVENIAAADASALRPPQADDLVQIFQFVDSVPNEPIMVHCRAGISRSTAVTLALIVRGFVQQGQRDCVEPAIEQLLTLRPQSVPNCLVLRLGLQLFMEADEANSLTEALSNHPQLLENRFINPLRE
jgi:predicted protein tyrosine phosphatase